MARRSSSRGYRGATRRASGSRTARRSYRGSAARSRTTARRGSGGRSVTTVRVVLQQPTAQQPVMLSEAGRLLTPNSSGRSKF